MIERFVSSHGFKAEHGIVSKGQAVIWAANLLHGGSPILEEGRSRHSQVTHYYFKDCAYFTPLVSDLDNIVYRHPIDVSTGELIASTKDGKPLRIPLRLKARAFAKAHFGIGME